MLTKFGEGATGAFLRICEPSNTERGLNETANRQAVDSLSSLALKRGDHPREGKIEKGCLLHVESVSRILLRSCGKAPDRVGNSGTPEAPRSGTPNHGGDKER